MTKLAYDRQTKISRRLNDCLQLIGQFTIGLIDHHKINISDWVAYKSLKVFFLYKHQMMTFPKGTSKTRIVVS